MGDFLGGQKFADEGDWFQGLSVVLENTSNKTITYIEAGFYFPEKVTKLGKLRRYTKRSFTDGIRVRQLERI